jgi:anti-sigma B factor antagonist
LSSHPAQSRDVGIRLKGAHLALSLRSGQRDPGLPDFHIRVLSSDARSVVYVTGELDAYTAARLRESLAELIGAGARQIVVDLAELSFMAASGLGVLVGASKRLRREEGKLLLRAAPPGVNKMIEITGLDAMLPRI